MKEKIKGITLIALVITIIILLILAGITITSITNNGLFEKVREAQRKYEESQNKEDEILKEYEEWLANSGNLPENTKDTKAGTAVKMPEEWYTQSPDIVETTKGEIVKKGSKTANVYAVSDGQTNTIPVPYGFYYVGGTLDTGVVISDNEKDRNKYAGDTNVPTGVEYDEETKEEKSRTIIGNQFVWIPCIIDNYHKVEFDSKYKNPDIKSWDKTTPNGERTQVIKYGGFYVGRYEAGMGEVKLKTSGQSIEQGVTTTTGNIQGLGVSWLSDVYTISKVSEDSKPTSKANEIPWFHADYETAYNVSMRMYNTSSVNSGLITGTMWDVMMKYIGDTDVTTGSNWGNYIDVTLNDCNGKYTKVTMSGNNPGTTTAWQTNTTGSNKNSGYYTLLSTGSSEMVKRKNLYDVAGNLAEWVQEMVNWESYYESYSNRGGDFYYAYATRPACFRDRYFSNHTATGYGFRVALYIK